MEKYIVTKSQNLSGVVEIGGAKKLSFAYNGWLFTDGRKM